MASARRNPSTLERFLEEYRTEQFVKDHLAMHTPDKPYGDWRDEVTAWWNSWVEQGWYDKRPQLFLFGESNMGKCALHFDISLDSTHQLFYVCTVFLPFFDSNVESV